MYTVHVHNYSMYMYMYMPDFVYIDDAFSIFMTACIHMNMYVP